MRFSLLILFFLIFHSGYSQNYNVKSGTCYRVNISGCYFYALPVTYAQNNPDTSYTISFGDVFKLSKFLEAHSKYKAPIKGNPANTLDIRTVFVFYDKTNTKHVIGFSSFGDYEFDGICYRNNEQLAPFINALKVTSNIALANQS
ncbi:MAG: hypothetical protein M3R17_10350 [Bacteroidota bacterium]|nr:hypothetical protein [Bacteroidota bacterium]